MINVHDLPAVQQLLAEAFQEAAPEAESPVARSDQVPGYPAKKLVLKDGFYRTESHEK